MTKGEKRKKKLKIKRLRPIFNRFPINDSWFWFRPHKTLGSKEREEQGMREC
jgi:hypothetical protein